MRAELVGDGSQALAALRSKQYALLLTDTHMPVMDGFELSEKIREAEAGGTQRLPIIAITASVLAAEIDRCFEAGMDGSLGKPIDMKKLKDTLHKWMPVPTSVVELADSAPDSTHSRPEPPRGGNGAIDPDAIGDLFGPDLATLKEILEQFIGPAERNIDEIVTAADGQSAKQVGDGAHKLKSSSRTVGANQLADVCTALEAAGHAGDWKTINRVAPTLGAMFAEMKSYVNALELVDRGGLGTR